MQELRKNNKTTGIYWLKQSLENLSICIKLKSKEKIVTLPKFEEYKERPYEEHLHVLDKNKINEHKFKWQEKVFSTYEFNKYSDIYNCSSETERKYHEKIKDPNIKPKRVFTYINEDYHLPLPFEKNKDIVPNLNYCFEKIQIDDNSLKSITSSKVELYRSRDHITDEDQWTAMHVILDNSEYNEDSQILFKQECSLLSLYHNVTHNYLMVLPDVNNLQFNPYNVEDGDIRLEFEYGVEIEFGEEEGGEELELLLNSLFKKWDKKKKSLLSFVMPPLGMKKAFVTFEIVSGAGFENDNLYVDYQIKIPDDLKVNGDLKGRTHVSKSSRTEDSEVWRYGHIVELEMEYATGVDLGPLQIVLEVISVDWWGRHRTEGYGCLSLAPEPGARARRLPCRRPEELDRAQAEGRRFFVGGCHLLKDLDVLVNPQMYETNFRYVPTGTISVRWSVIAHAHSHGAGVGAAPASAAELLRGADAVLRHYRKAKATLAAATRQIQLNE